MARSYIYVPGLARPGVAAGSVEDQVRATFEILSINGPVRRVNSDNYMDGAMQVLVAKGAIPVACETQLRWITFGTVRTTRSSKAFEILGQPSANLAKRTLDKPAMPIKTAIVQATLSPCTLPQYLAQPRASVARHAPGPLARLEGGDTLYIVGHSNPNGGALTYKCIDPLDLHHEAGRGGCKAILHSARWSIDPVVTASLLVDEGLPKVELEIVVVACFSGGVAADDLQTVQSFAQRLAGALNGRGFERIRVAGATGLTVASPEMAEIEVIREFDKRPDGTLAFDTSKTEVMSDDADAALPFYKRFFRFFDPHA